MKLNETFLVRSGVGIFDTGPLTVYRYIVVGTGRRRTSYRAQKADKRCVFIDDSRFMTSQDGA